MRPTLRCAGSLLAILREVYERMPELYSWFLQHKTK
jgi:hypothetical protein